MKIKRRDFVKGISVASIVPSTVLAAGQTPPPSDRITIGFIGVGGQGFGRNLRSFIRYKDCQILAACDVDKKNLRRACEFTNSHYKQKICKEYSDFREVIARDDLDSICISTPDHWHVPMSMMALRAGKDVICEKPTLTIAEGRVQSDFVRRCSAVFQTATEDRSIRAYHRMAELVRNGRIGKLKHIDVTLPGGYSGGTPVKNQKIEDPPPGFDYDMWLGPAPYAPYTRGRCHWSFRWIFDYSGGQLTDWGAHLLDTAQWANDTERSGPIEVDGKGVFAVQGIYNTAHSYHIEYKYKNGVTMTVKSGGVSLKFTGTDGWVGNFGWSAPVKASSDKILKSVIGPNETHLFTCPAGEHRNFLDCVKTRSDPYFPAEIGHRCASVSHIGNISMLLGKKLQWDPDKECFIGDDKANEMRSKSMRSPWTL